MSVPHPSRSRFVRVALVAASATAVIAAPMATRSKPASAVTIAGATNLADKVEVRLGTPTRQSTDVHLLAFNDFHGNLEAASLNLYGHFVGGAAYLAKLVKDRQDAYGARQVTLMAGDNIGASPLANGLFFEEPATIIGNLLHVDFASVGNHEFDKGATELKRIQAGGCRPTGCTAAPYAQPDGTTTNVYPGAKFKYLAANVIENGTANSLFPAYGIKTVKTGKGAIKIGVIGEVLKETPTIVTPSGVAGLSFIDEAIAANNAAALLKAKGVSTIVLVIHQGGGQTGTVSATDGCAGNLTGSAIADIASKLDPSIKVIVSGHTHNEYRCTISSGGTTRLITSASSFGRVLTDINLTIDNKTGQLLVMSANNTLVDNALNAPGTGVVRQPDPSKEDPQVAAVVSQYVTASAPLANKVIGKVNGDLTRTGSAFGESTLGDVIADSQLTATAPADKGGAKIAFMNPGGIRSDLLASSISSGGEAVGEVTYGEAFTVQPFGNSLVTKTMTGDMLRRLLQQQFLGCGQPLQTRILQISTGFSYQQAPAAATCDAKIGKIFLNGTQIQASDTFRVTMNSFLATGGDSFTVFNEGTDALGGAQDIDASVDYFTAAGAAGLNVPALNRIVAVS